MPSACWGEYHQTFGAETLIVGFLLGWESGRTVVVTRRSWSWSGPLRNWSLASLGTRPFARGWRKGSGHVPTFELSSRNGIMRGNWRSTAIPRVRSQSTCSLLFSTFVRHSRVTRYGTAICRVYSLATLKAWRKIISLTSFAINASDSLGQHSDLGTTRM